jgi:hypothetical protein
MSGFNIHGRILQGRTYGGRNIRGRIVPVPLDLCRRKKTKDR